MKYTYQAIIEKGKDGYSVKFNDVEGAYTCGKDLQEAVENAEDVLCMMLYEREVDSLPIPEKKSYENPKNGFVADISCDTMEYREYYQNTPVKKTLTIPKWLNTEAKKRNINFSEVLQEALKTKIGIL